MAKYEYYLDYVIIISGAILAVLLLGFLFLVVLALEDSVFSKFAWFITSVSVAVAPFTYFLKMKRNENDERTRASKNLYTELDNTLDQ